MTEKGVVFVDCTVYTASPGIPRTDAVAISKGRITSLGRDAGLSPNSWPRIPLRGSTILPGLIDSHCHLAGAAQRRLRLQIDNARGLEGILKQIRRWAETHAEDSWIIGGGWDESMWEHPVLPTRKMLDDVTGQRPAVIFRRDGHSAWLNSAALETVPLNSSLPDTFVPRDEEGSSTGLIRETALDAVTVHLPRVSENKLAGAILDVQEDLLALGITGVHTFETEERRRALKRVRENGRLKLRVYLSIEHEPADTLAESSSLDDIRGFKLYLDGSLGSHTAFTVDPDSSHSRGYPSIQPPEFDYQTGRALSLGLDVLVHAIGDGAVRMALDVYERYGSTFPDRMLRIEHAQLVHPDDMHRLSMPNLAVSIQPCHLLNDIELAERFWSSQIDWSYAWETIRRRGARLLLGTDFPIEPINPWRNMFIAMHRGETPASSWHPAERLAWDDVLRSYTVLPASCARWDAVGALIPGYSATLIVVSDDPGTLSSSDQTVHGTMVDGEIVYSDGFLDLQT